MTVAKIVTIVIEIRTVVNGGEDCQLVAGGISFLRLRGSEPCHR